MQGLLVWFHSCLVCYCADAHDKCCVQRLSEPVAVEKEPQNNLHFPAEERVKQMFKLLGRSRPMFILAILPDKDSEIYGS